MSKARHYHRISTADIHLMETAEEIMIDAEQFDVPLVNGEKDAEPTKPQNNS